MRATVRARRLGDMTTTQPVSPSTPSTTLAVPPLSGAARAAAGISLVLAGLLNGGAQYLGYLVSGDPDE